MAQDFYPFVDNGTREAPSASRVSHPARIAVYDDAAAAPRVVVVEPQGVREYLEEITLQVTNLSSAQGGTIPFMVIREIVENFIHAYFMEPTISILDHGNTLRFSDQGPGIPEKGRALQYGTTSATEEMRRYIRGVGSGLPYVHQYMRDKGGSLEIDDNISGGTVVTLRAKAAEVPGEQVPWQQGGAQAFATQAPQGIQPPPGAQVPWGAYMPQQPSQQAGGWGPQAQAQPQQPTGAWPAQYQQYAYPQYPPQGGGWPAQAPMGQQAGAAQQAPWEAQQPMGAAAQGGWPAQQAPSQAAGAPAGGAASVSVRGRAILDYLASNDAVGPSDLARAFGESQPTWTRELQALEAAGILRKDGQKRRLTAMGQSLLAQ